MPRNTSGLRRGGPGRPKGSLNKATGEIRALARQLVDDPAYRTKLRQRLHRGTLAPAIESLFWHYAYGKPHDEVTVASDAPLSFSVTYTPLQQAPLQQAAQADEPARALPAAPRSPLPCPRKRLAN